MGSEKETQPDGRKAGAMYREETRKEEREVERAKGSDLKKGQDRVEERAERSGGDRGVKPSG